MSRHTASIRWQRGDARFVDGRYSRVHAWRFDGGVAVAASASPSIVPQPLSDASAVDPEEAFVASLSSCHMLWFLSLAAGSGVVVESYEDDAVGELARNREGALVMASVTLRPRVAFTRGSRPSPEEHLALHQEAHESCFLARSVTSKLLIEPIDVTQ